MKITNIFKKEEIKVAVAKFETIEKNQLAKVIGGTDSTEVSTEPSELTGRSSKSPKGAFAGSGGTL